ncbi:MAG: hypothetical protein M3N53_14210 [Actinomycetota bacterium]|nr:hypothetical protein [Actinomycetota bacterium]
MTILVGGVSQLYQGDHDLGRLAVEMLRAQELGPDVLVEDLYYGAVAVVQLLEEVRPDMLILVGTQERGRPAGTVERRRLEPSSGDVDVDAVQRSVGDAVVGYVDLELTTDVVRGFGALPQRTVVIEVEPARTEPSEELSEEARAALSTVIELVRLEIGRVPLFELTDRLREMLAEQRLVPSPALSALEDLLIDLRSAELNGTWGATFARRDRLRMAIAAGETGEGMNHLDWGLWWALIEELDRLQGAEVGAAS